MAHSAPQTKLTIKKNFSQFVRIDSNFISQIIEKLETQDSIKSQLNYSLNNSLYIVGDNYRYVEYSSRGNMKKYHITELSHMKCIDYWYETNPTKPYLDFIKDIEKLEEVLPDEAELFFSQLLHSQIVVSELEPCVTGKEPLNQIIDVLSRLNNIQSIQQILNELLLIIQNPQYEVPYYKSIEDKIKGIVPNLEIPKNTVQVDMIVHAVDAYINKDVIDSLKSQITDLMCFNRPIGNYNLDNFKREFNKRYESRKIPLTLLLDNETGIDFVNTGNTGDILIDNLLISSQGKNSMTNLNQDYITDFAKIKYLEWYKKDLSYIEINEDEIKHFLNKKNKKFAESMSLFGSFYKDNSKFDKDNFVFEFTNLAGPSGANILGRFALSNSVVDKICRDLIYIEESKYTDVIFAEIAHLPEARTGNILLRPCFRSYEIAYIGKSGLPLEKQITIKDILVYIEHNKIKLWSQKHNKQIIPRLSTAHNFKYGLPIYKFLCELQQQGLSFPCFWDWGVFSNEKYLPRVKYKNIVWEKARWVIEEKDIKDLPMNKQSWLDFFKLFRKKFKLPVKVLFNQVDNNLLLDFSNIEMIEILVNYIKKYKNIVLLEVLYNEDNCIVSDIDGNPYTNEVIIPFEYINQDEK